MERLGRRASKKGWRRVWWATRKRDERAGWPLESKMGEEFERNDDPGLGGLRQSAKMSCAIKSFYINRYDLSEIAKRNMLPPAAPG